MFPRRDRRDKLKEFFEDSYGVYSMIRLGYFLSLLLSGFVVVTCTLQGQPEKATELVLVLNGVSAVGKVVQKKVEESDGNTIRNTTGGLGPVGDDHHGKRF